MSIPAPASPVKNMSLAMSNDFGSGGYGNSVKICTSKIKCCQVDIGDTVRGTCYDKVNVCGGDLLVSVDTHLMVQVQSASDDDDYKPDYIDLWTANDLKFHVRWKTWASESKGPKLASVILPQGISQ